MRKYSVLLLSLFSILCTGLTAQITVDAKIDSTAIVIGDQTHLTFRITQKPGQRVMMPLLVDSIPGGLDIVESLKPDTVAGDAGTVQIKKSYLVTAFEDSLLYIPALPFVIDGDTVWSKTLSLKVVQPFKIDTASHQIADIKPVIQGPFDWKGLLLILLFILLVHGLVVAGIYVYRTYFVKEPELDQKSKDLLQPAHVVALGYLDRIKQEKPWQAGRSKEYHTQLTDVLRTYIERMFNINSMEMTSDEILEEFRLMHLENKSVYTNLKQILTLADLVKFAKWEPAIDEHELSLMNAYFFINQTKIEEVAPLENIQTEEKSV